jgi:hypothetical protein
MAQPVFYDPQRARWKRLRRLVDVTAVVVSALVIFFVYTALRDEPLPELLFSPQKRAFKALKESEKEKATGKRKWRPAHRKSKLAASQVKLNQSEGIRAAFYVPWMRPVSRPCARTLTRSTCCIPTGCTCCRLMDDCRRRRSDEQVFRRGAGSTVLPVDDRVMPFLKTETDGSLPMVNTRTARIGWETAGFLNNWCASAIPAASVAVSLVRALPA